MKYISALRLYKYINDNKIEWRWSWHSNHSAEDVIILPLICQLKEFNDLLTDNFLDEGGYEISMKKGYVGIWMNDICEYYDIDIEEVFPRDAEKEY